MANTKTRIRGVDTYTFSMARSKEVPGAFVVTVTKLYRADSEGEVVEEVVRKVNVNFGEATSFFDESSSRAFS